MTSIHIQWAEDGQHIRKWAHSPFAGSTEYTPVATPIAGVHAVTITADSLRELVDQSALAFRMVEALKHSPAIEELTPGQDEWMRCNTVQDRYDLMKRCVDRAAALARPRAVVGERYTGQGFLTPASGPDEDGMCNEHGQQGCRACVDDLLAPLAEQAAAMPYRDGLIRIIAEAGKLNECGHADWSVHAEAFADMVIAMQPERASVGERSREWWVLEWIGAPRPPVHPNPMKGRQSFATADKALAFWRKQPAEATYVSLTKHTETIVLLDGEHTSVAIDRLAARMAKADGADWDQPCGYENDLDSCTVASCIGTQSEDHDPDWARDLYRRHARVALGIDATPTD